MRQTKHRAAIALAAAVLVVGWLVNDLPQATAQQDGSGTINREYQIKAAFLYNFGRYVQWPPEAFRDARAPFVIGFVGPSPVIPESQRIAKAKKIQERPIQIRQFSDAKEVEGCHILFLPVVVEPETRAEVIRRVSGSHLLLVGESSDFLDQGGVMNLVVEQNRVRVHVAEKAAQREKLTISSQLLRIATVVKSFQKGDDSL